MSVERDLERLYRRRAVAYRRALVPIAGADEAGAAVQEGFARALAGSAGFAGGMLEAWVWRILVRCALDVRRVARPALHDGELGGVEDVIVHDDPALLAAVRGLPEQRRQVVFLRYYADLSYREIAETLGIEVGTVSATLSQAHAALRATLGAEVRHGG